MSVNIGASLSREGGSIVWLSWAKSGYSPSTYCACVEVVLLRLAYYYPVLDDDNGILPGKGIFALSGGEVV
jgi:hypothetical protein